MTNPGGDIDEASDESLCSESDKVTLSSHDRVSVFGHKIERLNSPDSLPIEPDSPGQQLPDGVDTAMPWALKIERAYAPQIGSTRDNKFRVSSISPTKRYMPPITDPFRRPGTPHLPNSKVDNAIIEADIFGIEDQVDLIAKATLDDQIGTPRDRPGQLNDPQTIGSFGKVYTMPKPEGSAQNHFLKKNIKKFTGNSSSSMAVNIGGMLPNIGDITGHMNFGGKFANIYAKTNTTPSPNFDGISPFDINLDFLQVIEQFLKNNGTFFSSLNKDNTNFLVEVAKQEKAKIFNLSRVVDRFIEKGKVSNIMKSPNSNLPFYQKQSPLE